MAENSGTTEGENPENEVRKILTTSYLIENKNSCHLENEALKSLKNVVSVGATKVSETMIKKEVSNDVTSPQNGSVQHPMLDNSFSVGRSGEDDMHSYNNYNNYYYNTWQSYQPQSYPSPYGMNSYDYPQAQGMPPPYNMPPNNYGIHQGFSPVVTTEEMKKSTRDWPEAMKEWARLSFKQCETERMKDKLEKQIKSYTDEVIRNLSAWTIDWKRKSLFEVVEQRSQVQSGRKRSPAQPNYRSRRKSRCRSRSRSSSPHRRTKYQRRSRIKSRSRSRSGSSSLHRRRKSRNHTDSDDSSKNSSNEVAALKEENALLKKQLEELLIKREIKQSKVKVQRKERREKQEMKKTNAIALGNETECNPNMTAGKTDVSDESEKVTTDLREDEEQNAVSSQGEIFSTIKRDETISITSKTYVEDSDNGHKNIKSRIGFSGSKQDRVKSELNDHQFKVENNVESLQKEQDSESRFQESADRKMAHRPVDDNDGCSSFPRVGDEFEDRVATKDQSEIQTLRVVHTVDIGIQTEVPGSVLRDREKRRRRKARWREQEARKGTEHGHLNIKTEPDIKTEVTWP